MAEQQRVEVTIAVVLIPLLLLVGAYSVPAFAQTEVTFGMDSRFTDNARRSDAKEDNDLESRTYLTASYQSDPGDCKADFLGTLGYSWWREDSFDSESFAQMDFLGDCELANQFYWEVSNKLREVRQDTRQTDTPNNRTRKNVFSTGPKYLWRLTDTNWLNLSARYANTEYSEPEETDSERYTGAIDWIHRLSATFTAGLSLSHSETKFDYGAEVDISSVQVTFENRWTTTSIAGSVGASELETDYANTAQSSDGLVGNINLTRDINPTSQWYLNASRELTDRTSSLDLRFGEFEFNLRESITVENSSLSTGLDKQFSDASSLNFDLYAYRADYLESAEKEDKVGVNVRYSRRMSERTTGYLALGFDHLRYERDDSEDEVARIAIGAEQQVNRDLSLLARAGHDKKSSDDTSREYDESWVLLGMEYQLR